MMHRRPDDPTDPDRGVFKSAMVGLALWALVLLGGRALRWWLS